MARRLTATSQTTSTTAMVSTIGVMPPPRLKAAPLLKVSTRLIGPITCRAGSGVVEGPGLGDLVDRDYDGSDGRDDQPAAFQPHCRGQRRDERPPLLHATHRAA